MYYFLPHTEHSVYEPAGHNNFCSLWQTYTHHLTVMMTRLTQVMSISTVHPRTHLFVSSTCSIADTTLRLLIQTRAAGRLGFPSLPPPLSSHRLLDSFLFPDRRLLICFVSILPLDGMTKFSFASCVVKVVSSL